MRLIWPLLLTLILLGCTGRSPKSDLILKSAEDGDPEAQLKLAFAHMANPGDRDPLSGTPLQIPGIEFDERKAVYWLQKAATNGIGRAQLVLGHRYLFGAGVPLDFKAALGWYRQAAAKDTPHAEKGINALLAILDSPYRSEVDKRAIRDAFADEIKTTEELMRTALTGDVVSARRYGERLCDGVGVSRNYAEGLKFLRDAAERGDMKAQCRMGFIFKTGRGVTAVVNAD
jgi:TPR repeat protein